VAILEEYMATAIMENHLRRESWSIMNKKPTQADTWGEMLDVLKDIGTAMSYVDKHGTPPRPPIHMEVCYYCKMPIEDGVVKGGYTYCNLDHAIKNTLKKAEGEN
jgi:hypothetical protein